MVNWSKGCSSAVTAKLGNTDGVGLQALSVADKPPREDNIGRRVSRQGKLLRQRHHHTSIVSIRLFVNA